MARQLTINVDDNGGISVGGLTSMVETLGLLATAQFLVVKHFEQAAQKVQMAPPGLVIPKN